MSNYNSISFPPPVPTRFSQSKSFSERWALHSEFYIPDVCFAVYQPTFASKLAKYIQIWAGQAAHVLEPVPCTCGMLRPNRHQKTDLLGLEDLGGCDFKPSSSMQPVLPSTNLPTLPAVSILQRSGSCTGSFFFKTALLPKALVRENSVQPEKEQYEIIWIASNIDIQSQKVCFGVVCLHFALVCSHGNVVTP